MPNTDHEVVRLDKFRGAETTKILSDEVAIAAPVMSWKKEDGTSLTAQAAAASGFVQISDKDFVISIPVNGTELAFSVDFILTEPIDETVNAALDIWSSKGGALDALTVDAEAYFAAVGDIGNTDAVTTAAQTIAATLNEKTFTLGSTNIPASAKKVSVVVTFAGTNDGDIIYVWGARLRYTRKKTVG